MKKLISFITAIVIAVLPLTAFAVNETPAATAEASAEATAEAAQTEQPQETASALPAETAAAEQPQETVSAQSAASSEASAPQLDDGFLYETHAAMIIDADTGYIIYSKNPDEQIYPASTTKIMTALIAIENGMQNRDVVVTVCKDDFSEESSLLGLERGETIPGIDLLYGMMLKSGNDAAATTAIEVGGSIEGFAEMMNAKAQELGMTNTHFLNAHGVQNEEHYTTCADMAKLAIYAYQNNLLMQIAGTKDYTIAPTDIVSEERAVKNTNKLISLNKEGEEDYLYEYATGVKTGYTPAANGCLVASATKDGTNLLVLIYGDESEMGVNRWNNSQQMFEFGFNNYTTFNASDYMSNYSVSEKLTNFAENDPEGGLLKLEAVSDGEQMVTMDKTTAQAFQDGTLEIETVVDLTRSLTGPVESGEEFGTVEFKTGDISLGTAKLVSGRKVYALGEEDLQSAALGSDESEYWSTTNIIDEISKNKAVLWWLLVPGGIIAFLIIRTVIINKRRIRARRMPAARYSYGGRSRMSRHSRSRRYRGRYM